MCSSLGCCPVTRRGMEPFSDPTPRQRSLKMVCGAFYIPKERGSNPRGDDAHFIFEEKQTIGVADGVGSWSEKGVDAGEYARKLMSNFFVVLGNYPIEESNHNFNLKHILNEAYLKTKVPGSSTACILTLKNNSLHAVNVGDSGFLLLRDGEEFYKSPIQTSRFNCPRQLGKCASTPSVAQVSEMPVQAGDVIILGTDGLFDNLFTKDIRDVANFLGGAGADPDQVARSISEHAYYNSIDKSAFTPFTEASLRNGMAYFGGKKDDITVVVAFVVSK
ncbi:probable protein phosphatase 2C 80 isoform X2 [Primulina huaijiensis]|uniref:probable protein phosphatase 2C 80 isoform X2 n=1 Tax=Primulina huaijiensis TaxID=1492673 RepID=UPI003CC7461B